MVHMNIFYRIDLKICDSKSEFWTKTQRLGLSKNQKFSFGTQNGLFETDSESEMTSKYILDNS